MNNKIITGIWLVFFGMVFLLDNTHVIDFNFWATMNLWPLILVSIGITFLLQNRPYSKPLIIGANILICGFIFFKGLTGESRFTDIIEVNTTDEEDQEFEGTNKVSQDFDGELERASLTINGGAAKYDMNSDIDSSKLVSAISSSSNASLQLSTKDGDVSQLELNSKIKNNKYNNSKIKVVLNPHPTWDLTYNLGAASINADFKAMKIGSLTINSGATSVVAYLPAPIDGTHRIEINTAASSVKLFLPKGAACKVEADAIFSNNKYEGLDVEEDKSRKTADYETAKGKYDIKVEGAANSLAVLRY